MLHDLRTIRGLAVRWVAAALLGCATAASAQQLRTTPFTQPPQDTAGAITNFDVLGVKLGMPEAEAVALIKKAFPPGSKDSNGYPIVLKQSEYMLTNPVNHTPVRAGVKFRMHGNAPDNNYDFVKLLINDGKVWAVWRDDGTSRYDAEKFAATVHNKYAGSSEIVSYFDVVENGRRTSDGSTGVIGARLYQGACEETPPLTHSSVDNIKLLNGCSKAFVVKYGGVKTAGVKTVQTGESQLVDLDAGRQFFAAMRGMAADAARAQQSGDAKL